MVKEIPSPGFESAPNAIWLPSTIEAAALPNAATIKQTAVRRANSNIQRAPKSPRSFEICYRRCQLQRFRTLVPVMLRLTDRVRAEHAAGHFRIKSPYEVR